MGNPVWLEMCSCGKPTGNMVIAMQAPKAAKARSGHNGHRPFYERLCEDGARMTDDERERLHEAAEAFLQAASNPMRLVEPPKEPPPVQYRRWRSRENAR